FAALHVAVRGRLASSPANHRAVFAGASASWPRRKNQSQIPSSDGAASRSQPRAGRRFFESTVILAGTPRRGVRGRPGGTPLPEEGRVVACPEQRISAKLRDNESAPHGIAGLPGLRAGNRAPG